MTKFMKIALAATTAMTLATAASANTDSTLRNGFVLDADMTIVDNAMKVRNLTTLVDAVVAAGFAPTLSGEGPLTVFAPVNSAFRDLGPDAVEELLKPENQAALANVLQLHIVAGEFSTSDIDNIFNDREAITPNDVSLYEVRDMDGEKVLRLKTVGNQYITITENAQDYYIEKGASEDAEIIVADIPTSIGVIHIIDGVITQN